jgi:hypothetical protein
MPYGPLASIVIQLYCLWRCIFPDCSQNNLKSSTKVTRRPNKKEVLERSFVWFFVASYVYLQETKGIIEPVLIHTMISFHRNIKEEKNGVMLTTHKNDGILKNPRKSEGLELFPLLIVVD